MFDCVPVSLSKLHKGDVNMVDEIYNWKRKMISRREEESSFGKVICPFVTLDPHMCGDPEDSYFFLFFL